jgi:hypothetical protein
MCVELFLFSERGNIRKPKERDYVEDRKLYVLMQRNRALGCGIE